jgi:hypothetical protein
MKAIACIGFLAALLLGGCGQKDEPLPPVPTPPTAPTAGTPGGSPNAPAQTPTPTPPPNNPTPANAAAQYMGNLGNAQQYARVVSDTASINQAIQVFNANEGRYPKDLNELVTEKYMGHIPNPPRGMKFYYNPDNGEFRIVDE